jgi:signal peptidase I
MILRRFFSQPIREAIAMRKHVLRLYNAQRDLLSPAAIAAVQGKLDELNAAIKEGTNTGRIRIKTEELQFAAEKWIKPYPNPVWRENVEVLLVAIAVAMGIRTFFLQPFKIPTGSMQPTLYGITSENLMENKSFKIPTGWERIKEWFGGISYVHIVAPTDGTLDGVSSMRKFLIFNIRQTISIGGVSQTIWFPPDFGESPTDMNGNTIDPLLYRARLEVGRFYHKGDDVVKLKVCTGDHLFVDRLTYNFRKPERGEIVVFETAGIPAARRENPPYWNIPPDQFYIKRLMGLGGETISLKQDYVVANTPLGDIPVGHLVANGVPLSASTPHFENLYTFYGAKQGTNVLPFIENEYYGHAMIQALEPGREVQIGPHNAFMMGDNTMNSLDSRYWGDIPSSSIIGKSFFVYWPLTKRFGLDDQ